VQSGFALDFSVLQLPWSAFSDLLNLSSISTFLVVSWSRMEELSFGS
jgi:hypothetical protein